MKLLSIRYCGDLPLAEKFYSALGLTLNEQTSSPVWRELEAAGGSFALHPKQEGENSPAFELSFETSDSLESLQEKVQAAGFDSGSIHSEDYGRHLILTDPEGLQIRINEIA